jgi:hypothetical protein
MTVGFKMNGRFIYSNHRENKLIEPVDLGKTLHEFAEMKNLLPKAKLDDSFYQESNKTPTYFRVTNEFDYKLTPMEMFNKLEDQPTPRAKLLAKHLIKNSRSLSKSPAIHKKKFKPPKSALHKSHSNKTTIPMQNRRDSRNRKRPKIDKKQLILNFRPLDHYLEKKFMLKGNKVRNNKSQQKLKSVPV